MANPLQTLRYHVTGAIERGEAVAIEGKPMTDKSSTTTAPMVCGSQCAVKRAACADHSGFVPISRTVWR